MSTFAPSLNWRLFHGGIVYDKNVVRRRVSARPVPHTLVFVCFFSALFLFALGLYQRTGLVLIFLPQRCVHAPTRPPVRLGGLVAFSVQLRRFVHHPVHVLEVDHVLWTLHVFFHHRGKPENDYFYKSCGF